MKVNNKGFTLIELMATIIILALVLSITGFSIFSVINSGKKKNYELLISNINSAAELYYQECKYMTTDLAICDVENITLGDLVDYGYLTNNDSDKDGEDSVKLINPNTDEDITNCKIKVEMNNNKVKVIAVNATGSCPVEY